MKIHMDLKENSYDIIVQKGILANAGEHLDLKRKVLIVTDSGVPEIYAQTVAKQCAEPFIYTVETGEVSKSLKVFGQLLEKLLEEGFDRHDAVVAVGGGVVGDLAGFVASAYMRGIDFYNLPTTVLSQLDSSIGGKVAVNLNSTKNIIGAFYQPKKVLIDSDTLNTLDQRQISNGLAEGIKMGLTSDKSLFEIFEKDDYITHIDEIIEKSLNVKKSVVEQDEKEQGLRKILNFGHTVGHGIESAASGGLYHGECVALGMLYMVSDEIRKMLIPVLQRVGLPAEHSFDSEKIIKAMIHDKKIKGDRVSVVTVNEIGKGEIKNISINELCEKVRLFR